MLNSFIGRPKSKGALINMLDLCALQRRIRYMPTSMCFRMSGARCKIHVQVLSRYVNEGLCTQLTYLEEIELALSQLGGDDGANDFEALQGIQVCSAKNLHLEAM